MKRILLALALFSCSAVGAGDEPTDRTIGLINGRFWIGIHAATKVGFLEGVIEGLQASGATDAAQEPFMSRATYAETVAGIDVIYRSPENARLPVLCALQAFVMKVKGAAPAKIEERLVFWRKEFYK